MNLQAAKCPNCGAPIDPRLGSRSEFFCTYCGYHIVNTDPVIEIRDEKFHTIHETINQTINQKISSRDFAKIAKEERLKAEIESRADIERLQAIQDIERASYRRQTAGDASAIVAIVFIVLLLIGSIVALTIVTHHEDIKAKDTIRVGVSSKELTGQDYQIVMKQLTSQGFTNISLIDLDNAGLFTKEDTVSYVSIDGKRSFDSSDAFKPDVLIIIAYH